MASSLIAHVPRNDRGRWNSAVSDASRTNLKTAVAAWYGARSLSRDAFRTQFLDPYTSDEVVDRLRSAARGGTEKPLLRSIQQTFHQTEINRMSNHQEVRSALETLYNAASKFDGWQKEQVSIFIRVGEYGLALDGIAYAYLNNKIEMPPNLYDSFESLAVMMDLKDDPGFLGVAGLAGGSEIAGHWD